MRAALLLLLTAAAAWPRTGATAADRVAALPGAPALDFPLFAGHVTVNAAAGRALFYALAEAPPAAAGAATPLILWLNGGPGCSSLGGFLAEQGPFFARPGGKTLVRNPHAWNRAAHMLFLESPAMVGFSYSNSSGDAAVGDARTAADALAFLLGFVERHPRHAGRSLYLAGESYAGHYVPQLAAAIARHNAAALGGRAAPPALNLQGFLVGNPLTDPEIDSAGAARFWYFHGLISRASYRGIRAECDLARHWPLQQGVGAGAGAGEGEGVAGSVRALASAGSAAAGRAARCEAFVDRAAKEIGPLINIYDIFADVCLPARLRPLPALGTALRGPAGAALRAAARAPPRAARRGGANFSNGAGGGADPEYDPCIDSEVEAYLNRADVQAALHANASGTIPGPWTACTSRISYSAEDVLTSVLPVYEELLAAEPPLRILVFTGDVDAILPVTGTRRWVRGLSGLRVAAPWAAWRDSRGQVGGWGARYRTAVNHTLDYATIRGAGHMAPYTQPGRAFDLFSRFISGRPL